MDLYTLTLALDSSAAAGLRAWLTSILSEHAVARGYSRESGEIVLAAAEALNKAVRSSAPQGTTVVVTLSIVGRDVYVTVTDRDTGLTRDTTAAPADEDSDPAVASGLGFALMHGLMDQVDMYDADDGTTVRLVKRLRLPPPAADTTAVQSLPGALADASQTA